MTRKDFDALYLVLNQVATLDGRGKVHLQPEFDGLEGEGTLLDAAKQLYSWAELKEYSDDE